MAKMEAYAQTICRDTEYHRDAVRRFADRAALRFNWDEREA